MEKIKCLICKKEFIPESKWDWLCKECHIKINDKTAETIRCCKKIEELNDHDFAMALGLIGFKRIIKVVEKYNKNYSRGIYKNG